MSEIPEDVMKAAEDAVSDAPGTWPLPWGLVRTRVARAIMAERKRCAKVADHWRREAQIVRDLASSETAKYIAAYILNGDRR